MTKRDYYDVLGISKTADKKEMKKAYRKLVKEYHPDKNSAADAEEKFKEVQEAYETLGDTQKRKAYDQYGHAGTQGFGGFGGFGGGGQQYAGAEDINDIFNQFFGGQRGGRQQRQRDTSGDDLEINVDLSFEEAIFGIEKNLKYKRKKPCSPCKGGGAKDGTSWKSCERCNGQGVISQVQQTFLGQIRTQSVCPLCNGKGKEVDEKCNKCSGQGYNEVEDDFKIEIPKGIPDGVTLRFRERGEASVYGGPAGDLFVNIEVSPHESFERRGDDIYLEKEISVISATLGESIEVPTVHGSVTMKIPAGTQPGKVFRLSEKGGPKFRGNSNGDQYVKITVIVPKKLSKEARKKWEELKSLVS